MSLCIPCNTIDYRSANLDYSPSDPVQFTSTSWSQPQTVWVRAVYNNRVDGMDTHVFAPQLSQLNNVQGPLFVNGGEGASRTGLLEREPVMLPRELNETPAMGSVVSSTQGTSDNTVAATVTINPISVATVNVAPGPVVTGQPIFETRVHAY